MRARFKPTQMFCNAYFVLRTLVEQKPKIILKDGMICAAFRESSNKLFLLFSPASDNHEITKENAGTIPLPDVLKFIQKISNMNADKKIQLVYFVPLAQCRNRAHWTLLTIENNLCKFYDPKSAPMISWLEYDLSPVNGYLADSGMNKLHPDHIFYAGIQPLMDDTHCGYVVTHLIRKISRDFSLEEIWKRMPAVNTLKDYADDFKNEYADEHEYIMKANLEFSFGNNMAEFNPEDILFNVLGSDLSVESFEFIVSEHRDDYSCYDNMNHSKFFLLPINNDTESVNACSGMLLKR